MNISKPGNLVVTILALAFCAACISGEVEEGDHALVLKVGQLREYGLELPRGYQSHESISKETWFDGSVSIEYEFEALDNADLPFVYCVAEVHRSAQDAALSYSTGNFAAPLGLGDAQMISRNDLFSYGDVSEFALFSYGGEPYGNYFAMQDGKTVFMVMTSGFYFDDGELWAELIEPNLAALSERN